MALLEALAAMKSYAFISSIWFCISN